MVEEGDRDRRERFFWHYSCNCKYNTVQCKGRYKYVNPSNQDISLCLKLMANKNAEGYYFTRSTS